MKKINFSQFKEKINSIIDSTTQENHVKICKLIGEKAQLLDNLHRISENVFETVNNDV